MRYLILISLVMVFTMGPLRAQEDAGWSANAYLFSDYVFRGVSQSDEKPVLQADINWQSEGGFYAGIWASNVAGDEFDGVSIEVDPFIGWLGKVGENLDLQVQLTRQMYNTNRGFDYDYNELQTTLTINEVWNLVLGYSNDVFASGRSGTYYAAKREWTLPADFGLEASLGWYDLEHLTGDSYIDWSIGISKSFGQFSASLHLIDTASYSDVIAEALGDAGNASERLVFSLAYEF